MGTSANTIQIVSYETTALTTEAVNSPLSQFNPYFYTRHQTSIDATDMSCEGRPISKTADGFDNICLNVNDEIFVAAMPTYDSGSCGATGVTGHNDGTTSSCIGTALSDAKYQCNPIYLNKYKVTNLSVEPLTNEAYAGNEPVLTFPYIESPDFAGRRSIVSLD